MGLRCDAANRLDESSRWLERVMAALGAPRPERSPVDRYRDLGADTSDRLCRSVGIEVSGWDARAPASDRQKRDIDSTSKLVHAIEQIGIPREIHRGWALKQVAQSDHRRSEGVATSVMLGVNSLNGDIPDRCPIGFNELDNLTGAVTTGACAAALRDEQPNIRAELPKRSVIEVVTVRMRDQDRRDRSEVVDHGRGALAANVEDAGSEEGIGQDSG
jgi:hypothetical protein